MIDRSVTVDERFADFQVRYTHGQKSQDQDVWYGFTKQIEQELFPDGPPSFS
jgi:Holliday junction resolvasome RuvABC DNA-binding subunit